MTPDELNNPQTLSSQYRDSSNLNSRIQIHSRFSTNHYGWQRWVFDQLHLQPQSEILDLGCGPGNLWRENLDRIPEKWNITLADFSEGMLQQAHQSLDGNRYFEFQNVDARANPLPFVDDSFDAVIANHLFFHISDRQSLFSEIARILKPNGHLYASTVGQRNMFELIALISEFDSTLAAWGDVRGLFNLENGATQLSPWFTNISMHRYEDALVVNEIEPLLDYILSGYVGLEEGRLELNKFKRFVKSKMKSQDGVFHITKDTGIFEAKGI